MKIKKWIMLGVFSLMVCLTAMPFALPEVLAEEDPTADHGRKPSGDDSGIKNGDIFGDLWLIVRDLDNNGQPLRFKWTWSEAAYNEEGELDIQLGDVPDSVTESDTGFFQPYSLEPLPNPADDPENPDDDYLPFSDEIYDSYGVKKTVYLIPLDDEGKIPEAYEEDWAEYVMEADLGRLNVARSTQDVLDAAYNEAMRSLALGTIGLDPAGRLTVTYEDGTIKTIDSPLENIALYQKLMLNGFLPVPDSSDFNFKSNLAYLNPSFSSVQSEALDSADLLRAASFLGGAADKFGHLNIDMVIYANTLLGINTIKVESSERGVQTIYVTDYFNFDESFLYNRYDTLGETTASLLQPMTDGSYEVKDVLIKDTGIVFERNWPWDNNHTLPLINFVRAADDALSVVFYIHNFEVPEPVEPQP